MGLPLFFVQRAFPRPRGPSYPRRFRAAGILGVARSDPHPSGGGSPPIGIDRPLVAIALVAAALAAAGLIVWGNRDVRTASGVALGAIALLLVTGLGQLRSQARRRHAERENAALVGRLHQQMALAAQASRETSQFLASASHDLRQPLHALSFFGATLERRLSGSREQPLIHNMMRSIEALDQSFGAILDLSKLDAGAVEPRAQAFPIRDVFRRLHLNYIGHAEEAGLQLRFRSGGHVVTSDPQLLERILGNLVSNALRYSRPGGGALVAARRRSGGISLEIWDSGIGIEPAELPRIFAEFYQVANPERDRGKGLGMGLAIVKRLAQLLGHTLAVRSLPGRGSVFRIWVKASDQTALEDFALPAETVPGALDASRTVLVLDDEEAIRTSVGQLLAEWGYDVLTAATTDDAVDQVVDLERRGGTLDCIVTDLRLRAGDDGLAAIARLRETCGHDVPALLVTGDTAPEQMLRVHASGHIALWKPVQPAELLNVLKRLLR